MDHVLQSIRDYWDAYAENLHVDGEEYGTLGFFTEIKILHDQAYGYANRILDLTQLQGKSLLELAPGVGLDTVEFAAHGANVTAVDLSPRCVSLARMSLASRGLPGDIAVGNVEELPFEDNSFDVVVARGLFMYTRDDERLLNEILRVARPGGTVQILLHNRRSWYVALARISGSNLFAQAGDPPVNRVYSASEARRIGERFESYRLYYDRFPSRQTSRSGFVAWCFDSIFVPLSRLMPGFLMEPMGFYMIIRAVR